MVIGQAVLLAIVALLALATIVLWAVAFYQAVADILEDRERERKRRERGNDET